MSAKWSDLNAKQRKLALVRWHERKDGKAGTPKADPNDVEVAPGLTLGQLKAQTKAGVQLKYGEAEQQLQNQPGRVNNWFSQYQQAVKDAQAQQTQNYNYAAQGVQNLQGGLDDAARKAWAGQQAAMSADAGNRGATVDPQLADVAHNASNVRNALTGSFGAMLVGQGANENAYLAKRNVNAGLGRVEALKANAQQRQALAKDKGAYKVKYRDDALKAATNNFLAEQLALNQRAELVAKLGETGAKTKKIKTDAAQTAAETAFLKKYGYLPGSKPSALDQAKLNYFDEHGYLPPTGPPKTPKDDGKDQYGNTRKERERYQNQWARARSLADLIGGNDVGELTQLIVAKDSTTPVWMATAAAQQIALGYVGPNMRKRLLKHGVKKGYKASKGAGGGTSVPGGGV